MMDDINAIRSLLQGPHDRPLNLNQIHFHLNNLEDLVDNDDECAQCSETLEVQCGECHRTVCGSCYAQCDKCEKQVCRGCYDTFPDYWSDQVDYICVSCDAEYRKENDYKPKK